MSLELHQKHLGKISVVSKVPLATKEDLSTAYTPGVAEPCRQIEADADNAYLYTSKGNMVAVVSDGSAVLGLGNIGGDAALPVMEGKAILFKGFADVDAFPICLSTQDDAEIIATVKNIAPSFGGINLEDIAAPRCFYIERELKAALDIPVFHDDQHGTAICVLAGIINACYLTKRDIASCRIVMNGIGAAGNAISRILMAYGAKNIVLVDKNGIINKAEPDTMLNWAHAELAELTNPEAKSGGLAEALVGADIFVGVSLPGLLTKAMVATMNANAIVFAMANPTPEIFPEDALAAGAAIVGTGRSDFPNQINNVLVFPGVFKGAFAVRATDINEAMKMAAAEALANYIPRAELRPDYVIPSALDKNVATVVAEAVAKAAKESGVAKR